MLAFDAALFGSITLRTGRRMLRTVRAAIHYFSGLSLTVMESKPVNLQDLVVQFWVNTKEITLSPQPESLKAKPRKP